MADDRVAGLVKDANYPLLAIGLDTLRIVGASEAAAELLGTPSQTLSTRHSHPRPRCTIRAAVGASRRQLLASHAIVRATTARTA